jgi:hypothetical protein
MVYTACNHKQTLKVILISYDTYETQDCNLNLRKIVCFMDIAFYLGQEMIITD